LLARVKGQICDV